MKPLWVLQGSGVLQLRDFSSAMALIHYRSSPVGAYDELAVVKLTACGPSVTSMLVNSAPSCEAGRRLWGFPKRLGDLCWRRGSRHFTFRQEQKYFRVRGTGGSFPVRGKAWTVQRLNDQDVRVPCEITGRAKLGFRGKQLVLVLESFELRVFPPLLMDAAPKV